MCLVLGDDASSSYPIAFMFQNYNEYMLIVSTPSVRPHLLLTQLAFRTYILYFVSTQCIDGIAFSCLNHIANRKATPQSAEQAKTKLLSRDGKNLSEKNID